MISIKAAATATDTYFCFHTSTRTPVTRSVSTWPTTLTSLPAFGGEETDARITKLIH